MNRHLTTQDVSWFLDLYKNKRLDLDPPYQRRSVWSVKDQRFFLDTIFRNFPCPAIFLYKGADETGRPLYFVVDGKQRLETIINFTENKISIAKDFGNNHLDGKRWNDLDINQKQGFWNYTLPVEMLSTVEGTVVNEVFDRFNRNSRKLERQELRHAKYDGWFITITEEEADKDEWIIFKIVTKGRSKRMKDVQFISELLLIILDKEIVGFDQNYLDTKYSEYDDVETDTEDGEDVAQKVLKDQFYDKLDKTKTYLLAMEEQNGCISNYANTFVNFYILWAVIVLTEPLPNTDVAAAKYAEFMETVKFASKGIKNESDTVETAVVEPVIEVSAEAKELFDQASRYYVATQGANTDLPKRQERFNILSEILTK